MTGTCFPSNRHPTNSALQVQILNGWRDAVSSSSESLLDHSPKKKKWKQQKKPKKPVEEELTHFDPLNIDDPILPTQTGRGTIVAVDLLNINPVTGVQTLRGDFLQEKTTDLLHGLLCADPFNRRGKVDVVLSDMEANISGNDARDTEMSLEICQAVFEFARWHLRSADEIGRKKGGVLLMKFFAHPDLQLFREEVLEPSFNHVYYIKPDASRSMSREGYFLCQGWNPTSYT
ncbi:FtsJ-like methyltransferase-domain-containing protein [Panaeolus papilionaceus]|nr:FtsJ-like methyltransferase-domain-containing protein [Panaeolus papilionaceus]